MQNENESMMMDDNNIYEVSFILDNRFSNEEALKKADSFKEIIASLEGSFISEEAPYLRELSYEMIRVVNNINVRFKEGYFGWIKFELSPSKIADFDKNLKLDENLVRYLIVKTERDGDVFTKDLEVIKSDPSIYHTNRPQVETLADVNIDTTLEDLDNLLSKEEELPLENLEKDIVEDSSLEK